MTPDRSNLELQHKTISEKPKNISHIPTWARVPTLAGRLLLATLTATPSFVIGSDLVTNLQNPSVAYAAESVDKYSPTFVIPVFGPNEFPSADDWIESSTGSNGKEVRTIKPGQTMVVTSGHISFEGKDCGDQSAQICVLLYEVTKETRTATIDVDPGAHWLGIAPWDTNKTLQEIQNNFWQSPNCGNQTGCDWAKIYRYKDGILVNGPDGEILRRQQAQAVRVLPPTPVSVPAVARSIESTATPIVGLNPAQSRPSNPDNQQGIPTWLWAIGVGIAGIAAGKYFFRKPQQQQAETMQDKARRLKQQIDAMKEDK